MVSNVLKPTPPTWGMVAAAIIAINAAITVYDMPQEWFMWVKMGLSALSAALIVFTAPRPPQNEN